MSTKATIAHDADFHIYEELMDDSTHLELRGEGVSFSAEQDPRGACRLDVQLPQHIIEAIVAAYEQKKFPHQIVTNDEDLQGVH